MNSIGNKYRFTSFGESHGAAVGGVIDGCPAGLKIDFEHIRTDLDRRAGRNAGAIAMSERSKREADNIEWLSGIVDGTTTGTPIAFLLRNTDAHSSDYEMLRDIYRPGHADYTYQQKYGIRDYRGGGRASARETASRVIAGAIAKQVLRQSGIGIAARVVQVGSEADESKWENLLQGIKQAGDSIGGIVECRISGMPIGIGEPIFDKLQARLAYAVMSINACKGFEYDSGFDAVGKRGSELNNTYSIEGGISNGRDISFRAVFKPTPSISMPQETIDETGERQTITIKGRHDTCVALRAPVIVEAMAAITVLDLLMAATLNN